MKRILMIMLVAIMFITGCDNKEEEEKNEYLAMKSDLLETEKYTDKKDINCDILVNIDRETSEKVVYKVTLSNPKENMNNIKAILVHNYYTEEVFPTVGLFNKQASLTLNDDEDKSLELSGTIETTDDIEKIGLELKLLIEYTDDEGKIKDIYYKST